MFTQTNVPIPGLLDGYESALTEMGYSMTTKIAVYPACGSDHQAAYEQRP